MIDFDCQNLSVISLTVLNKKNRYARLLYRCLLLYWGLYYLEILLQKRFLKKKQCIIFNNFYFVKVLQRYKFAFRYQTILTSILIVTVSFLVKISCCKVFLLLWNHSSCTLYDLLMILMV
jgi:hypothetical protein